MRHESSYNDSAWSRKLISLHEKCVFISLNLRNGTSFVRSVSWNPYRSRQMMLAWYLHSGSHQTVSPKMVSGHHLKAVLLVFGAKSFFSFYGPMRYHCGIKITKSISGFVAAPIKQENKSQLRRQCSEYLCDSFKLNFFDPILHWTASINSRGDNWISATNW